MVALALLGMTVVTVVAVGYPLFAGDRRRDTQAQRASDDLLRLKMAVYRDIKDLEFDRGMGKVSDEDYAAMRTDYESEAVRVLEAMDGGGNGRADRKGHKAETVCPRCGRVSGSKARFCSSCGQALWGVCPSCGTPAGEGDRFCAGCGRPMPQPVEG
jgi:hypothetical protein